MAAGQGFKTFATGDVLSAADVNGYLMQGVLVFADSAERDAEITSPEEGQFAYLKDTNVTTYYTGSAWANLDTTGMTNPMTTTGDVIYSSSGSTPARLGIGTAGQVLQVNSGATAPEWATAVSGAFTSIASGSLPTGSGTLTLSSISGSYKNLRLVLNGWNGSENNILSMTMNNDTTAVYGYNSVWYVNGSASTGSNVGQSSIRLTADEAAKSGDNKNITVIDIPNYATAATGKLIQILSGFLQSTTVRALMTYNGYYYGANAAVDRLDVTYGSNYAGGTYILYGVN